MDQEEPQDHREATKTLNPKQRIEAHAPWLLAPDLGTCVVGSSALHEACNRAGIESTRPADLDLAWALDIEAGEALLREHDVFISTTSANRARGTLALSLDGERVELTSFRDAAGHGALEHRIRGDLERRDMTVGAIAWWLERDRIVDPFHGLEHWRDRRVVPVGSAADRVREHPIRWPRYYRKAHTWGFELEPAIRKLDVPVDVLDSIPPEAIGAEIRSALRDLASPGLWLQELFEVGVLQRIAPELAAQFDGRPAGPVRHHPEISQALHLVLALEVAVRRTASLPADDGYAVRFAVLCHDLGKNLSDADSFPSHHGHEHAGIDIIQQLCQRLPGLADQPTRRLATQVSALHLTARQLRKLRSGTLAKLYERHFRQKSFRRDLFAMAVAADTGGRYGREHETEAIEAQVIEDLDWLCSRCERVDTAALRAEFEDVDAFRTALHERRARAIQRSE